jgi:hypothetical protein
VGVAILQVSTTLAAIMSGPWDPEQDGVDLHDRGQHRTIVDRRGPAALWPRSELAPRRQARPMADLPATK